MVRDGDTWPVGECPECESEALVHLGERQLGGATFSHLCFGCGTGFPPGSLDWCGDGEHWFEIAKEELVGICSAHFDEKVEEGD